MNNVIDAQVVRIRYNPLRVSFCFHKKPPFRVEGCSGLRRECFNLKFPSRFG